jgi:glycerate kinase
MRVLVAPDSFGGTLSATEAAAAIAGGWSAGAPHGEVTVRPLADGGPGFVDALAAVLPGRRLPVSVPDPRGRETAAELLVVDGPNGRTAYVESAQACGLHLVPPTERHVRTAGTYGVGVLLAAAAEAGPTTVVVGLGGSATNDGGAGMLAALGVVAVDEAGDPLQYGGAALAACAGLRIEPGCLPLVRGAGLVVATDVDNPLVGLFGASAVYGPQKGASDADVLALDAALERWAEILVTHLPGCPPGLAHLPGAGAAGGLGAALLAVGAARESGAGLVRRLVGLDAELDDADLVVTGEGRFDEQSLHGKLTVSVAAAAQERGIPCLVLAGQVAVGRRKAAAYGVDAAYSVAEHLGSVRAAIDRPAEALAELAERIARQWGRGEVR